MSAPEFAEVQRPKTRDGHGRAGRLPALAERVRLKSQGHETRSVASMMRQVRAVRDLAWHAWFMDLPMEHVIATLRIALAQAQIELNATWLRSRRGARRAIQAPTGALSMLWPFTVQLLWFLLPVMLVTLACAAAVTLSLELT